MAQTGLPKKASLITSYNSWDGETQLVRAGVEICSITGSNSRARVLETDGTAHVWSALQTH